MERKRTRARVSLLTVALLFIILLALGLTGFAILKHQQVINTRNIQRNTEELQRQKTPCTTEDVRHPESSPGCRQ